MTASLIASSPSSAKSLGDLYQHLAEPSLPPRGHDSTDVEAHRQDVLQAGGAGAGAAAMTNGSGNATPPDVDPQGPFEGPEKLLELWFADCPELLSPQALRATFTILQDAQGRPLDADTAPPRPRVGLRAVPRAMWEGMLDIVKCKVLSVIEGQDVDAYLLSESSMFVFPHKIILKTCGTTTLLLGLQRLLELAQWAIAGDAKAFARDGVDNTSDDATAASRKALGSIVQQCFYSRKSFMFPERQKGPHRDWMLEVRLLDAFFDDGSAYTVGKMNGDHWLLYMCCPGDVQHAATIERPLPLPAPQVDVVMDRTLEILMTHLSPKACSAFEFPSDMPAPREDPAVDRGHLLGMDLSDRLGLTSLFPRTELDAFAFEPCGYSANAVVPASSSSTAGYWTIHVTPEEGSSYASFETNVALTGRRNDISVNGNGLSPLSDAPRDLPTLIARVVDIFQPGKMSVTLFISSRGDGKEDDKDSTVASLNDGSVLHALNLPGYSRKDRIAYEFDYYDLVFCHFEKRAGGK